MPPTGFEPAIPASERQQTHVLGRLTTGTGAFNNTMFKWISVVHVKNMHQPQINITANEMCNFTKEVGVVFSAFKQRCVYAVEQSLHSQFSAIIRQWRTQEFCSGEMQQIQLRTEGRENGDLGAVAS
jgi:hypothetical protein